MANDIIEQVRRDLASDIHVSHAGSRVRIGTPLVYDDGDHCTFFIEGEADRLFLTDLGDVLMRAGYEDADLLSEGYRKRFDRTLAFYGMQEVAGNLVLPVDSGRLGESIFSFAQGATELVKLASTPKDRKKRAESKFRKKLIDLITTIVPESRLDHNWHDETLDPEGVYPVDFRIHTDDSEWYVFGVGTPNKCLHATISCQRYRLLQKEFTGLAIYRDKDQLPENATKPLDAVVDEKFPTISREEEIAEFIESRILKRAG